MSTQFKTLIGSIFAVAALISLSTGAASAQDKSCMKTQQSVKTQQQSNSVPSQFSQPGYLRGK